MSRGNLSNVNLTFFVRSIQSIFSIQSNTSFADTVKRLKDNLANLIAIAETLIQPTVLSTKTLADVLALPKPIMGDIIAVTKDSSRSAWTGGKPNPDWTELNPSSQTEMTSLNQLSCPVYVSAAQKGYNHCQTRMTTLFKAANDNLLASFQNEVWDHLMDTCMDSMT